MHASLFVVCLDFDHLFSGCISHQVFSFVLLYFVVYSCILQAAEKAREAAETAATAAKAAREAAEAQEARSVAARQAAEAQEAAAVEAAAKADAQAKVGRLFQYSAAPSSSPALSAFCSLDQYFRSSLPLSFSFPLLFDLSPPLPCDYSLSGS